MLHNKLFKLLLLGAVLTSCLAVVSCAKAEEDVAVPAVAGEPFTFSVVEEDPIKVDPATKSVLTDGTIETKRTGITIGVYYTGGALVASQYYTSFGDMTFPLENGVSYTAYALVNMGDMRSSLPGTTAGLSSLTYTIPAYTGTEESVNSRGIPMAGSLTFTVSSGSAEIPVKRLLAKVTAVLSCDWAEAKIKSAKVYNMNKTLKPFGVSAASGASDMLAFQELQSAVGEGTTSLVATFYVPENMQGTVAGITGSSDKAGDRNATVGANAAKLTYLQTAVESEGKYDGAIVYRSYLGNNATTNFDLERNCRYAWTIHYKSDKVDEWDDDWKHDYDDLEIIDYSLSLSPSSQTITAGSTLTFTTTLNRNVIRPSVSSTPSVIANTGASWTSSDPSVATVSAAGVVTGVATGTATITASYTPEHFTARTATANITVQSASVDYELEIVKVDGDGTIASPVRLKAKYWTLVAGSRTTFTDVTSSASWTIPTNPYDPSRHSISTVYSGGEYYAVVSADASSGDHSVAGTLGIHATYNGEPADKSVTFTDVITYELEVTASTPTTGRKWNAPATLVATYHTLTNGYRTASANVSNAAEWEHTGGSVYTVTKNASDVTVAGNTSANPSHAIEGTTTVTARYNSTYQDELPVSFVDERSIDIRTDAGVSVSAPKLAVGVNRSFKAYYTVNGISGYVAASWSTGSASIATVTTGSLTVTATGVAAGNTTLTASYGSGTVAASKTVDLTVVTWSDDWDDDDDLDL